MSKSSRRSRSATGRKTASFSAVTSAAGCFRSFPKRNSARTLEGLGSKSGAYRADNLMRARIIGDDADLEVQRSRRGPATQQDFDALKATREGRLLLDLKGQPIVGDVPLALQAQQGGMVVVIRQFARKRRRLDSHRRRGLRRLPEAEIDPRNDTLVGLRLPRRERGTIEKHVEPARERADERLDILAGFRGCGELRERSLVFAGQHDVSHVEEAISLTQTTKRCVARQEPNRVMFREPAGSRRVIGVHPPKS